MVEQNLRTRKPSTIDSPNRTLYIVLFTDVAELGSRNGITNSHNSYGWSDESPCATIESRHQERFSLNFLIRAY